MTDKVQKIREEVERIQLYTQSGMLKQILDFIDSLQEEPSIPEIVDEHYWEMLGEEPVSDTQSPVIFYGLTGSVGNTKEDPVNKDFEMALAEMIDKAQKCVVEPLVVAEQWKDELIKLAKSEEPVSEDLGEYISELSKQFPEVSFAKLSRIAVRVAKWQKEQDQSTIELAEDHAMLAGMEKMKEQMMKNATEVTVHIEAGNYPYIPQMELYDYDKDVPLAKKGDKYKVILIKKE